MTAKDKRARGIQQQIREVLLRQWDPIHVGDEPQAHDEYDGYIGAVYRLLANGAEPIVVALARGDGSAGDAYRHVDWARVATRRPHGRNRGTR